MVGVSDFVLGPILGEGSFAQVFEATMKTHPGKKVAVKAVDGKKLVRFNKTQTVMTEKQVLATAKHPAIVKIYFTCQDASTLYFGLELCSGGEISQYARKLGGLPIKVVRVVIAEIVLGIEHLHGLGIAHRDLKPENVLVRDDGHVCLTDFGTAKIHVSESSSLDVSPSRKHSFVGSPQYVAPELLKNQSASFSVDFWSLGCLLFSLLCGYPPFRGASEYLTFQKILKSTYRFPDGFPDDARDLVEKLLNPDPSKRIGCCSSGIEDIKTHSFFNEIDWDTVCTTPTPMQELLNAYHDKIGEIDEPDYPLDPETPDLGSPDVGVYEPYQDDDNEDFHKFDDE